MLDLKRFKTLLGVNASSTVGRFGKNPTRAVCAGLVELIPDRADTLKQWLIEMWEVRRKMYGDDLWESRPSRSRELHGYEAWRRGLVMGWCLGR